MRLTWRGVSARAAASLLCLAALGARADGAAVAGASASAAAPDADRCPPDPAPLSAEELDTGLRAARDAGLLWTATRDGRTSYLYGTIHIARREWMFPGPSVLAALRASDTVALELDPTDPGIAAVLQRALAARPGAPALPAPLARRLQAQVRAACADPAQLAGSRPEMQAVTLEVLAGRRQGLYPAYGIDLFIAQLARGLGKPLRSLETPRSQAALLVSDDPRETARSVGQILDELESAAGATVLERLAGDWYRGDLDDLAAYGLWCDCLRTAAQRADYARLIDARNSPMAARIARWHGEGRSLFVAVGSLHMVGKAGLPALLRARGFDVRRVDHAVP